MSAVITGRQQRNRGSRRIFAVTLVVCSAFAVAVFAWIHGPGYAAYWRYSPREGDIVFQSLPHSRLANAIEGVTESPYSHCGIVAKLDGKWVVYEAYRTVEATPLREVIFRGRNHGFAVYRLVPDKQRYVQSTIQNVKTYLGRQYDVRYRMDDDEIYCTELIFKAYQHASGGEALGTLVRLGDLRWRPYEDTIKYYERGPVPLDREMITPRQLAQASQLELVFAHGIATTPR